VGVTDIEDGETPEVSDQSVFIKGEWGRRARPGRFGYSLGLTVVAPLENQYRSDFINPEAQGGTFPNEWLGPMPEVKFQIPEMLPFDVALDLRLMAFMPERASLIVSFDPLSRLGVYGSIGFSASIGGLAVAGSELGITDRLSLMVEYSRWLSSHSYPGEASGATRAFPESVGLAVGYVLPRKKNTQDLRRYASAGDRR
jgi:hypothetical protein